MSGGRAGESSKLKAESRRAEDKKVRRDEHRTSNIERRMMNVDVASLLNFIKSLEQSDPTTLGTLTVNCKPVTVNRYVVCIPTLEHGNEQPVTSNE